MSSADLLYFADRCREMATAESDNQIRLRLLEMAREYDFKAGIHQVRE